MEIASQSSDDKLESTNQALDGSSNATALADRDTRRKLKKQLKKLAKGNLNSLPTSSNLNLTHFQQFYSGAKVSFELVAEKRERQNIRARPELQQFLMWCFNQAPSIPWITIKNKALLSNVVLIFMRNVSFVDYMNAAEEFAKKENGQTLSLSSFTSVKTRMPHGQWRSSFHQQIPVDNAVLYLKPQEDRPASEGGGKTNQSQLSKPYLEGEIPSPIFENRPPASTDDEITRLTFEMSLCLHEMRLHNFPLLRLLEQSSEDDPKLNKPCTLSPPNGYMVTRTAHIDFHRALNMEESACSLYNELSKVELVSSLYPKLLAVDCEMCEIEGGILQLSRVTIIDEDDNVVLDEFVKPVKPIVNYLTQYSGVTAADMESNAHFTLHEIQQRVIDLIDEYSSVENSMNPAFLVGHSLESDLHALKIVHSRVLDTCLLFPHNSGLPAKNSLRSLAKLHLDRQIQEGHGSSGHDSAEDAIAALHLVQTLLMFGNEEEGEEENEEGEREDEDEEEVEEPETHPVKRAKKGDTTDSVELSIGALFPGLGDAKLASIAEGLERLQKSQPFDHDVRGREGEADDADDDSNDDDQSVETFAEVFLRRSARDFMTPPDFADPSITLSSGRGLTGVGALLHALRAPPAEGPEPADDSHPLRVRRPATVPSTTSSTDSVGGRRGSGSVRGGRGASMLNLDAFAKQKDVCAGVSLVGSPSFVNAHVCGTANGICIGVSDSVGDFTRCLSRVSAEVTKLNRTRVQDGTKGLGFVIGEVIMPKNAETGQQEWTTVDEFLRKWINDLPFGTCVVLATQGDVTVDSTGDAAYGVTFVTTPDQRRSRFET
jgi:DNA polymerase III epsilon subunit-like protein